jgi:hypothetical protein
MLSALGSAPCMVICCAALFIDCPGCLEHCNTNSHTHIAREMYFISNHKHVLYACALHVPSACNRNPRWREMQMV